MKKPLLLVTFFVLALGLVPFRSAAKKNSKLIDFTYIARDARDGKAFEYSFGAGAITRPSRFATKGSLSITSAARAAWAATNVFVSKAPPRSKSPT